MILTSKFSRDIFAFLHDKVESAELSIIVSVAWFTDPELVKLLLYKKIKGTEVKCIVHNSSINSLCPDISKLGNSIRVFKNFNSQTIMHNKYCIIDSKHIITGSYNWTKKARDLNYENILHTDDPNTVDDFTKNFQLIWEKLTVEFDINNLKRDDKTIIENKELLDLELDYNNEIDRRINVVSKLNLKIDINSIFKRIESRTAVFIAKELATALDGELVQSGLQKLKDAAKLEYSLEESIILKEYSPLFNVGTKKMAWIKLEKLEFFKYPIYLKNLEKYIEKPQ